jgi:hypothetical protein
VSVWLRAGPYAVAVVVVAILAVDLFFVAGGWLVLSEPWRTRAAVAAYGLAAVLVVAVVLNRVSGRHGA